METVVTNISSEKGVYKLRLPVKYLLPDASEADTQVYNAYKQKAEDVAKNGGVLILPAVKDSDGDYLFDFQFVGK